MVGEDGSIQLLGRGSAVINTGGEKVFPEEVEEVLKTHPAVADAACVGVPDDRFGEAVCALVELRPGMTADPAELIAHVETRPGQVQGSSLRPLRGLTGPDPVGQARLQDLARARHELTRRAQAPASRPRLIAAGAPGGPCPSPPAQSGRRRAGATARTATERRRAPRNGMNLHTEQGETVAVR